MCNGYRFPDVMFSVSSPSATRGTSMRDDSQERAGDPESH